MDDINGDGKANLSDVKILYDIANELGGRLDEKMLARAGQHLTQQRLALPCSWIWR